ncbi:hypothetical protein PF004_g29915, partial [Phytophthora fragariae]
PAAHSSQTFSSPRRIHISSFIGAVVVVVV